MNSFHSLMPATILGALVFGAILSLLGSIKLPLSRRLGVDESAVGGLLAALNLALIPMMLLGGMLIDELGVRWIIIAGSIAAGLGVFLLACSQEYRTCL